MRLVGRKHFAVILVIVGALASVTASANVAPPATNPVAADAPVDAPSMVPDGEPAASPVEAAASDAPGLSSCPADMAEVLGDYCARVKQRCVQWMPTKKGLPKRCAKFAGKSECTAGTTRKHFCIDRYEFPNKKAARPEIMKSFAEAEAACSANGKRLCGSSEWTLACEGRERLPYPYGNVRSSKACNIDKPHPDVRTKAWANDKTRDAEVARLWQGEASGARAACVSPYGVFDMTGNVDEWVVNESGKPFKSGLKGGYWGPVRDGCRPMTTAHGETFRYYQTGFRCCADPAATAQAEPRPPEKHASR